MSVTATDLTPTVALFSLWAVFLAGWTIAALWNRPTVGGAGFRASLPLYAGAALALALLLWARTPYPILTQTLWNFGPAFGWAMVVVTGLALGFSWWARLHLGALWSIGIARKEDHRVVDTGPYAIVRHPIYTGLIVGMFAMAAERAKLAPIILAVGVAIFFALKARLEERFLRAEFGSDYDVYRVRVPMIVPFLAARKGAPR
jgi:protein-S-isoprenylcysteine O-methyltransferase Ste14